MFSVGGNDDVTFGAGRVQQRIGTNRYIAGGSHARPLPHTDTNPYPNPHADPAAGLSRAFR